MGWRVQIDDEEIFLEVPGLSDDIARGIEGDAVAVEDEFVISADLVDIDEGRGESFDLVGEELESEGVFSFDEGGSAGVDGDFGAGAIEVGDGVLVIEASWDQAFVVPEILADGESDRDTGDANEVVVGGGVAGFEVASLVEHVVGWKQGFEILSENAAIAEDSHGVMEGSADGPWVSIGVSEDDVDAGDL